MLIKCNDNVGHAFVILPRSKNLTLKGVDINILYLFLKNILVFLIIEFLFTKIQRK